MNSETLTSSPAWYKDGEHYFLDDDTELRTVRPWERPESWVGKSWYGWFIGLAQSRDSDALTRSNYECFVKALKELPDVFVDDSCNAYGWDEVNTVYRVYESHWACGWVEWVAIHPSNTAAIKLADEMMCQLEDYPVLDDEHYSELESEEVCEYWSFMGMRDRIELCAKNNESIFAARRDYPPDRVYDDLRDF